MTILELSRKENKKISILIVATSQRWKILSVLLKFLILPGNREFIKEVIINPLDDDVYNHITKENIDVLFEKHNIKLIIKQLCDLSHPLGICRNKLAEIAAGEILSFLDDDVVVVPGWGKSVVEAIFKHRCDIVAGILLPPHAYRDLIRKSFSRYVARGLTVYNTWFLCRCGMHADLSTVLRIYAPQGCYLACSSGLWGANLSIKSSLYNKLNKKIILGYTSKKPIGGDDTIMLISAFQEKAHVCLSLRAAAYHFAELRKITRNYIFSKYSYLSTTLPVLLEGHNDINIRGKNRYFMERLNTIIQELLNDFSIKPIGAIDTIAIAILILLKQFTKTIKRTWPCKK